MRLCHPLQSSVLTSFLVQPVKRSQKRLYTCKDTSMIVLPFLHIKHTETITKYFGVAVTSFRKIFGLNCQLLS
jgi:hypothetical protein